MLLEQYLDFTSLGTAEGLFKVKHERYVEMCAEWEEVESEIIRQAADYSFKQEHGPEAGRTGLCAGKALARLMQTAKTPNEELICLYVSHTFIERIIRGIEKYMWQVVNDI